MKMLTSALRATQLCLAMAVVFAACRVPVAEAQQRYFSARINGSGFEVEGHIGAVGLMYAFAPDYGEATESTNGVETCRQTADRTYLGARYFFDEGQDSWYIGGASYSDDITVEKGPCIFSDLFEDDSGAFPMFGYAWLWDSGFGVDLGFRPGLLALGFSF